MKNKKQKSKKPETKLGYETNDIVIRAMEMNDPKSVVMLEPREGFDKCIVGISETLDGASRIVYSKSKILTMFRRDGMSQEEAVEYYEYNTVRALAYMETPDQVAPLLMEDMI